MPPLPAGAWRLLLDDTPFDAAWNMAFDRAIQVAREAGDAPPTLRLYRWKRPTVSLGRFQDAVGIDHDACRAEGIDLVRRHTGGRGVLHDDELTYSIIAGLDDGIPRGTAASYRVVCQGLIRTYELLGLQATLTRRPRGDASSPACYLHSTAADVSLDTRKLSGSAQVWHGSTMLQHGSFTITRNLSREARVFRLDELAATRMADETVTIVSSLGRRPADTELAEAAIAGMEQVLGIELSSGEYTRFERETAASLVAEASIGNTTGRKRAEQCAHFGDNRAGRSAHSERAQARPQGRVYV